MSNWKEFISKITFAEHRLIISEYQQFERDGAIGDCVLRSKTEEWLKAVGDDDLCMTSFIMRDIAFESFRYFANQRLEQFAND